VSQIKCGHKKRDRRNRYQYMSIASFAFRFIQEELYFLQGNLMLHNT